VIKSRRIIWVGHVARIGVRRGVYRVLVGKSEGKRPLGKPCIPDSHPHKVTNTKYFIDTIISPDDGHIVARIMQRKEISIPRTIVHQVVFIYKIIQGCR